ncbi:antibiotic biosynthesis monooxygenase [Streptomyces sp. NPDC028635]|uniref:antibiotic biosynthesis monooxygenase family protein n=1 Tax=Streptomyces sp. NPDC028635 TaxID=3154800 RepID=UPI0033CD125C
MSDPQTVSRPLPESPARSVPQPGPGPVPGPVPVPAHEPPYYAVVFTSVRTADEEGYAETSERMEELVGKVPGYLGMDHARSVGGLSITVGYFRDGAALEAWRGDLEHQRAQRRGRAQWYDRYSLHVAKVERSHSYERPAGD